MRARHIRTALVVILSGAVVVAGIVIIRQASGLSEYDRRHVQDVQALGQLREAVHRLQAQGPAPAAPSSETVPAPVRGGAGTFDASLLAARDAEIDRLHRELQDAHDGMARLQAQLQSSDQGSQQALAAANDDFQKQQQGWQARLQTLQQQLQDARAEAQTARERAASLQADNARMRSENGPTSARTQALRKTTTSLQDVNRRRDAYLNSILRRYRDITDQFHAMTGELDSNHGSESSSFTGVALSRIENALSLAEDDLRRVNELSAQSRQLESKLAKM